MEGDIKIAHPWALDWCVDCPHCGGLIEGLDELKFGREYTCEHCGQEFYIEQYN